MLTQLNTSLPEKKTATNNLDSSCCSVHFTPNCPVKGDDFPHSTGHSDDCIQAFRCFKKQDDEALGIGASTIP